MSERERLSADEGAHHLIFLFGEVTDDQAQAAGRLRPRRRVPGRRHDPRRGRTGVVLLVLLSGMLSLSRRVQGGGSSLSAATIMARTPAPSTSTSPIRACRRCAQPRLERWRIAGCSRLPAAELGRAVRAWYLMAAHLLERLHQGMDNRGTIERHERLVALGSVAAGLTHRRTIPWPP